MGIELHLSRTFHPHKDGHLKRTNQTLKEMLRACALYYIGSGDRNLLLMKFAYNNIYHSGICMALVGVLYA